MMGKHGKHNSKPSKPPARIEVSIQELRTILEHARPALSAAECDTLKAAIQTLELLTRELEKKSVSVRRLKQWLFGAVTETTAKVMEKALRNIGQGTNPAATPAADSGTQPAAPEKPRGHGRNGAAAYTGARKVRVPLGTPQAGDACPSCVKGTVYASCEPGLIVRLTGQAPIGGTVYELEKVRCHLCGEVFSAPAPEGVGEEKYDAASAAMIGLLKYGTGVPFHRLEQLQDGLGIPLPAATQWEIVAETAQVLSPALEEMVRQAAQGEVLHNDDTTMRVLGLEAAADEDGEALAAEAPASGTSTDAALTSTPAPANSTEASAMPGEASATSPPASPCGAEVAEDRGEAPDTRGRRGVFTSGIIARAVEHTLALFFTGHQHAGENLLDVLRRRAAELGPPIQMCDALSRNVPEEFQTILANCLAHGRRRFVDVAGSFPDECLHVLEILKVVYANDATARERRMSPDERLRFHQAQSGPAMADLEAWMAAQIEQRKVEPNSGLGEAIAYMRKHWNELTLFLRVPGAPLDNNICERALKKAILHRKNAYFYKTENGARVGDLFMSLIHTCELNGANPLHYLTELQNHAADLAATPAKWMPWNYLARLQAAPDRSSG